MSDFYTPGNVNAPFQLTKMKENPDSFTKAHFQQMVSHYAKKPITIVTLNGTTRLDYVKTTFATALMTALEAGQSWVAVLYLTWSDFDVPIIPDATRGTTGTWIAHLFDPRNLRGEAKLVFNWVSERNMNGLCINPVPDLKGTALVHSSLGAFVDIQSESGVIDNTVIVAVLLMRVV